MNFLCILSIVFTLFEFFPFLTYLHIILGTTDEVCRVNEVSTAVIAGYCGDRYINMAVTGRVQWGID